MKHLAAVCLLSAVLTLPVSDAFGWGAVTGRVVALLIAAQWAELRCVDHMAGQSPEGLPVVWRLVDHTEVLPLQWPIWWNRSARGLRRNNRRDRGCLSSILRCRCGCGGCRSWCRCRCGGGFDYLLPTLLLSAALLFSTTLVEISERGMDMPDRKVVRSIIRSWSTPSICSPPAERD